jgi:hypothetical protein
LALPENYPFQYSTICFKNEFANYFMDYYFGGKEMRKKNGKKEERKNFVQEERKKKV